MIIRYQCLYYPILFLIIGFLKTSIAFNKTNFPPWTWKCIDKKCVPYRASIEKRLQSLDTCNMVCSGVRLWPLPTGHVNLGTKAVAINPEKIFLKATFAPSKKVHEFLRAVFEPLRRDLTTKARSDSNSRMRTLMVRVAVQDDSEPQLRVDTDESYSLSIRPTNNTLNVDIGAKSYCGARHGLETLSQLVWLDPYSLTLYTFDTASVEDAPRFKYRGLMLDTARSYIPLREIYRIIDGMGASKLNTFHWHVTDATSFPLTFRSLPQLGENCAYSSAEIYTEGDVQAVVQRARLRGVRVLLEIDVPAHIGYAWSWGLRSGLGPLTLCVDAKPWSHYCLQPPCGQLNPRNLHVYVLLQEIYDQVLELTGVDDIVHLGGDDISEHCWTASFKNVSYTDLWLEYMNKVLKILKKRSGGLPNLILLWSSSMSPLIKKSFLHEYVDHIGLQSRGSSWMEIGRSLNEVRMVISYEDVWDLNDGYGSWFEESGGPPFNSWERVYSHRPWVVDYKSINWCEGGEATVWTWQTSGDGLSQLVWPRAAALAERLWSDRTEGVTRDVRERLVMDGHALILDEQHLQTTRFRHLDEPLENIGDVMFSRLRSRFRSEE